MTIRLVPTLLLLSFLSISSSFHVIFVPYHNKVIYVKLLRPAKAQRRRESVCFAGSRSLDSVGDGKGLVREKKKRRRTAEKLRVSRTDVQRWRVFGVEVHPDLLVIEHGIDSAIASRAKLSAEHSSLPLEKKALQPAVLDALFLRLQIPQHRDGVDSEHWSLDRLPTGVLDVRVVRRSLDARINKRRMDGLSGPRFNYVIDVDVRPSLLTIKKGLKPQPGRLEVYSLSTDRKEHTTRTTDSSSTQRSEGEKSVIIVGAGPAGLFCALQLARTGRVKPIVLERGQPVESRGKDIGALIHRRSLDSESNFAFGEGGAGTWSDGKLTTRIGRNSEAVRFVLETLVEYGAPDNILVEGAPHLGTDNLVRLLRNMRTDLRQMGGEIRFGCRVSGLIIEDGKAAGVEYARARAVVERNMGKPSHDGGAEEHGKVYGDAVVIASGHSARDVYEKLHEAGVKLEPKGFAVGFRVEHPQKLVNKIQYGTEWGPTVVTGRSRTDTANKEYFESSAADVLVKHKGRLPVPSYRLATDQAFDGCRNRGVYSFCQCPGTCLALLSMCYVAQHP